MEVRKHGVWLLAKNVSQIHSLCEHPDVMYYLVMQTFSLTFVCRLTNIFTEFLLKKMPTLPREATVKCLKLLLMLELTFTRKETWGDLNIQV